MNPTETYSKNKLNIPMTGKYKVTDKIQILCYPELLNENIHMELHCACTVKVWSKILQQASHKLVNILTLTIYKYEAGVYSLLSLRVVFNVKD